MNPAALEMISQRGKTIQKILQDLGVLTEMERLSPSPEEGKTTFGSANPIKAVEKFIGYFDPDNKIAFSPSISFNVDFSVARAYCMYTKRENADLVYLDAAPSAERTLQAKKALDHFRRITGLKGSFVFYVEREKRYLKAKGMSESSAVAAAVSRALVSSVYGYDTIQMESQVSRFAKFVSGSGTRASVSGLSIWLSYPGINEEQCFASEITFDLSKIKIAMFPKYADFTTNQMHEASVNSPLYEAWLSKKYDSMTKMLTDGIAPEQLVMRAEEETLDFNSLLMSAGRAIQTDASLSLVERIIAFRKKNEGLYFTADTGPSIMVMSLDQKLINEFLETEKDYCVRGKILPGVEQISSDKFKERAKGFYENYEAKVR